MSEPTQEAAQEVAKPCFEVEQHGNVTVLTLTEARILEDELIQRAKEGMLQLVDEGQTRMVIDFCRVEFMSSAFNGALITLRARTKERGGMLVLCNVRPEIYAVFEITWLDRFFCVKRDLSEALTEFPY